MARAIIAAVFVVLIFTLGAVAVQDSVDRGGEPYTIEDESIADSPLTGGATYEVDNADVPDARFQNRVVIENESGVRMVAGDDYIWHPGNATVEVVTGGGLDGDSEMLITYQYNVPSEQQRELGTYAGNLLGSGEWMMWVFGAVIAITILRLLVGAGP